MSMAVGDDRPDDTFTPLPPTLELALLAGRRAFPKSQELLAGSPVAPRRVLDVGWYGTGVDLETGAFALVRRDSGLDDLVGDILQVDVYGRSVFVYVLRTAAVVPSIALTRRAFAGLTRLSAGIITCEVAVVR